MRGFWKRSLSIAKGGILNAKRKNSSTSSRSKNGAKERRGETEATTSTTTAGSTSSKNRLNRLRQPTAAAPTKDVSVELKKLADLQTLQVSLQTEEFAGFKSFWNIKSDLSFIISILFCNIK